MRARHLARGIAFTVLLVLAAFRVDAQPEQRRITRDLSATDARVREQAVHDAARIALVRMTPELRSALVGALSFEGLNHIRSVDSSAAGTAARSISAAAATILAAVVAAFEDSLSIPALVNAAALAAPARKALADFGELAAPRVIAVAMDAQGRPAQTEAAIQVLTSMAINRRTRPLSLESLAQMNRVAEFRLASGEGAALANLWAALDLAVAVGDQRLRNTVERIAVDPGALASRGVTDPRLVEQTQRRANNALRSGYQ